MIDCQGAEFEKMFHEEKELIHREVDAWPADLKAQAAITATLEWPRAEPARAPSKARAAP